mgnify:FL=1
MGCCDETNAKFNCGERIPSACVFYKKYFPSYSTLDKNCATIEETTEELYKNQEYILRSIDTSKLTEDCIDYPTVEINGEDKILIVDILQKIQDEICEMKEESTEDNSLELDFKCLVSPCGETITSLKDLLQVLINEICILKGE